MHVYLILASLGTLQTHHLLRVLCVPFQAEAASAARGGPAIAVAIDVSAGQATVE